MKVCERRGYDKLLGLLVLISPLGLVLWGILAWGKGNTKAVTEEIVEK